MAAACLYQTCIGIPQAAATTLHATYQAAKSLQRQNQQGQCRFDPSKLSMQVVGLLAFTSLLLRVLEQPEELHSIVQHCHHGMCWGALLRLIHSLRTPPPGATSLVAPRDNYCFHKQPLAQMGQDQQGRCRCPSMQILCATVAAACAHHC